METFSFLQTSGLISAELAKNMFTIFARKKRRREIVDTEYNSGRWKDVLSSMSWNECQALQDFLVPRGDENIIAKINNKYVRIKRNDYYEYRVHLLNQVLGELAPNEAELVECGCGYGWNVFALLNTQKWNRLTGLDLSENAINAARHIAKRFDLSDKATFDQIDLVDGSHKGFNFIRNKTILTYYCLEQLKCDTEKVIANMIRYAPKRVIHIEPTTELLHPWSPKDWLTYLYIFRRNYLNNLVGTLLKFERRGFIKIQDIRRLYYSPTPRNDPTLVCWEPIKKD